MVVADTSAIIALASAADRHHGALRKAYDADPAAWVLPWAILSDSRGAVDTRRQGTARGAADRRRQGTFPRAKQHRCVQRRDRPPLQGLTGRLLLDTHLTLWAITDSRMLVAQALAEPMRLLTHDAMVARYSDTVILV